jgi:hypothetical protein
LFCIIISGTYFQRLVSGKSEHRWNPFKKWI